MSGEGLSGAAGFFLGKMAAENAQNNYNFVQRMRNQRQQNENEATMQHLLEIIQYARKAVDTLGGRVEEKNATIAQLRSDNAAYIGVNARLVEDYGRLEQHNAEIYKEMEDLIRRNKALFARAERLERRSNIMNSRIEAYIRKEDEWEAERNSRSSSHDGGAG